jgi:dehydrogenase/reductase SDR family member 7
VRFKDQVVWITGASAGIGEALAIALHGEGAHLVLSARRASELGRVKNVCTSLSGPGDILTIAFDVTDETARAAAFGQVMAKFGRVDVLINNAGVSQRSLGKDTQLSVDRGIMEVNFFAAVALTKIVLPSMLARKCGYIAVTSSVSGRYGVWNRTAYCGAKHAVQGFFDSLRIEVFPHNIDVTTFVFGAIQTEVSKNALTGDGTPFGTSDTLMETALPLEQVIPKVVDGLAKRRREIVVAEPVSLLYLRLSRFWPGELFRRQTKRGVEKRRQAAAAS